MNRLETISALTKGYDTIADIGSDHAYVCIEAVKKYGVKKAYACDINEGPLINAKFNISYNHLNDKIETVLSNGLKDFNEFVDLYIIAGMGGRLIKDILNDSLEKALKAKALILEPNNEEALLREFLFKNNFSISKEIIIKDGKHYYEIMVVNPLKTLDYNNLDILFGPILRREKSNVFIEKYTNKLNMLEDNLKKASDKGALVIKEKIDLIKEVL